MAQLISQSHALCIQTFEQLCKAAADSEQCPESFQLTLLDELDKYRIWSGNLGASHAGRTYKLSLDYRLREATFYKDQVISIVDTLQRHVEDARQIVCGERKPFEDFSESDSDEESPDLSPSNETPYSKGHDSPWESSSESGSMPESEPSKVEQKASDEISGLLPPATELAQLLEAIKLTIRNLYKLPIRKPAPVDRLKGNLTDAVSCFQPFDCMYVRDKFPRLRREVADRIGSHITRRRQLLLYRQEHQELLRPKKVEIEPGMSLGPTESQNIDIKQHLVKTSSEASSAQLPHATASQPESKHQTFRSKATTFIYDKKQPLPIDFLSAPSVAESISHTSIAASSITRETPVEVPPRPKDLNGISKIMFECKFCALTTRIESDRAWKKHVLSDLQPYVCTFPECSLGDHMFATRDAWFQHEMQMHRVEYFCNAEAHLVHKNLSEFKDHMQREHDISLSDLANPVAMNVFRRPVSSSEGICNLCFRDQPVKNMKSHVSKHLEQVSLFAIPMAEHDEGDVDEGENQSCQVQHNLEETISRDDEHDSLSGHWKDTSLLRNDHPAGQVALEEDLSEQDHIPDALSVGWEFLPAKPNGINIIQTSSEPSMGDNRTYPLASYLNVYPRRTCSEPFTPRIDLLGPSVFIEQARRPRSEADLAAMEPRLQSIRSHLSFWIMDSLKGSLFSKELTRAQLPVEDLDEKAWWGLLKSAWSTDAANEGPEAEENEGEEEEEVAKDEEDDYFESDNREYASQRGIPGGEWS